MERAVSSADGAGKDIHRRHHRRWCVRGARTGALLLLPAGVCSSEVAVGLFSLFVCRPEFALTARYIVIFSPL